jgi:rSAM/selenodomain-associated transferase 2
MEKISVVIPSYNEEEDTLAKSVQSLNHDAVIEVIIVESGEKTVSELFLKANPKVKYIQSENNSRALQMNEGACIAEGGFLLFMHADSSLSVTCIDEALDILKDKRFLTVSFNLRFDSKRKIYRLLEFGVRLRNFLFRLPFGDQCYFLRKEDFLSVAGFDAVPILEDVKFIEKQKKRGRVRIAASCVTTLPRRYEERGAVRTSLKNYMIIIMYYLKFSLDFIARFY